MRERVRSSEPLTPATNTRYDADLQEALARGWNTWDTRSVLSHVFLPQGFCLRLGIRERDGGEWLEEALIGRQGDGVEQIVPGPKTYDGRYGELRLEWRGIEVRVQSAVADGDLVLLVTPGGTTAADLRVEACVLWNRPGHCGRDEGGLFWRDGDRTIRAWPAASSVARPDPEGRGAALVIPLDAPVGFSSGRRRTVEEIESLIEASRKETSRRKEAYGGCGELYDAIRTCLAWDTIYDPLKKRVVSPVSRLWNVGHGGYILFCWDNYFAALMAALDSKELAYANAIAMTQELTPEGFVPNFANPRVSSRDRSQPPVGAFVVRELFRKFREVWLIELLFDDLLRWNRWWWDHRRCGKFLCWGTTPYPPVVGDPLETHGVNELRGAALESGLDNSPMYDDMPFDSERHLMQLADVGLMGLYGMDCEALADLADVLGRDPEAAELRRRADAARAGISELWDEAAGIYLNRRTDTGGSSPRLSPTNFYPLLCRAATPAQAVRLIEEHLYNPEEFWGDWVMPSIARNDPAYPEQEYWRGRIWAPMNFLVYLGLRHYDVPKARTDLARKSADLLLKEWRTHRHVHENYNAETGEGCDSATSDRFYHWGGLLGMPALIEAGFLEGWEKPL